MNRDPLIFLHIPRTGGMSVRNTMDRVYGRENIGRPWWGDHAGEPVPRDVRYKDAWYGHFRFGLHEHIGRPNTRYITILREPTERVLSEFKRNKWRERYGYRPIDLVRDTKTPNAVALAGDNLMTRMLSGCTNPNEFMMTSHVDQAVENLLEHFCFVGFTHCYADLEAFVRDELGWPIESLPHDNKGRDEEITDEEREELKTSIHLEADYQLWHRVRPSLLTKDEIDEALKQGAKGVRYMRENWGSMFSAPVGGPRFR